MRAWIIDAEVETFTTEDLASFTPIGNDDIRQFLASRNNMRTILVAPKGYGKSLLLKKKVADLRGLYAGQRVHIHPSNAATIVEPLRIDGMARKMADWEWAKRLSTHQQWSEIWTYAIGFLVCVNESREPKASAAAKEAARAIDKLFLENADASAAEEVNVHPVAAKTHGKGKVKRIRSKKPIRLGFTTVRNFFSAMAQNWDTHSHLYSRLYTLRVQSVLDELETLHFLFLDSPDESLDWDNSDPVRAGSSTDDVGLWGSFADQWVNFNVGLVDAIRRLRQMYGQIRVFTAIRTEALNAVDSAVGMQYEQMCVRLSYTKQELRQIFEINIRLMAEVEEDQTKLVTYPFTDNCIKDFIGISEALHEPTNVKEDTFDAIIRHTRWTPRDLMIMGEAFSKLPVAKRKACTVEKLDPIRDLIDEISGDFLKNHISASIPLYPKKLPELLANFRTNIIHDHALRSLAPISARNSIDGCPFDYLYAQGLFAWVGHKSAGNANRINFLEGQKIASRRKMLPTARWYAFHPIYFGYLREVHGDGKSDPNGYISSKKAIVGNENEISLPAVIRVTLGSQNGVISICGARIVRISIVNNISAVMLLTLISHALAHETLECDEATTLGTYDELAKVYSWIRSKAVKLAESTASRPPVDTHRLSLITAFAAGSDETRKINGWFAEALGLEKSNRNLPMRIRYERPHICIDGILLSEISIDSEN